MIGPSLPKISDEFSTIMLAEVQKWNAIAPPNYDAVFSPENVVTTAPSRGWVVNTATKTGKTTGIELGGVSSLSERVGVYLVTISIPQGQETTQAWRFAGNIEAVFRRKVLDGCIQCEEPYTEIIGPTKEDQRFSLMVTIPWSTLYNTEV